MKKLLAFFLIVFSSNLFAVNLQKFHFSNSSVFATVEDGILNDGFVTTDFDQIFVVSYNYVRAPFIELDNEDTSDRARTIIDWMHTVNYGGAYKITPNLQLGFSSFFTHTHAISAGDLDNESAEVTVAGDSTLDLKYKFYEKNRFAISFTPKVYLPTGSEDYYTSNGETGYYFGFALDKAFSFAQIALNLGHKENNGADYDIVDHRRQFHFSVGALIPLIGAFDLTAEFYRDTPYDSDNEQIPSELNTGIRYQWAANKTLYAGVGTGSLDESDSTDLRSYIGIKLYPSAKEFSKKIQKEEKKFGKFYKLYDIFFATNSSNISKEELEKLDELVLRFKQDIYLNKIVIEGYASRVGSKTWNKKLSEQRAQVIREYLLEKNLPESILEFVGYGNDKADEKILDKAEDRKVMFRLYRSR